MRAKGQAVIFDMDGVLVDSEPVINEAAIQGLKEFGVEAKPEDFIPFIGTGEDRYIGGVAEKYGVKYKVEMKKRVYEIYLTIVEEKIKIYEGIKELIKKLIKDEYTLALASSADKIKVEANLSAANICTSVFSALITGDDVENKKPAPDIYLAAAKKINIDPSHCIVIEDALNGIEAGKKAGMKNIGVATSFDKQQILKAGADDACDSAKDLYDSIIKL